MRRDFQALEKRRLAASFFGTIFGPGTYGANWPLLKTGSQIDKIDLFLGRLRAETTREFRLGLGVFAQEHPRPH